MKKFNDWEWDIPGVFIIAIIIVLVITASCMPYGEGKLTAQEVAAASQECRNLGLRAVFMTDGLNNERISCRPHKEGCSHE